MNLRTSTKRHYHLKCGFWRWIIFFAAAHFGDYPQWVPCQPPGAPDWESKSLKGLWPCLFFQESSESWGLLVDCPLTWKHHSFGKILLMKQQVQLLRASIKSYEPNICLLFEFQGCIFILFQKLKNNWTYATLFFLGGGLGGMVAEVVSFLIENNLFYAFIYSIFTYFLRL